MMLLMSCCSLLMACCGRSVHAVRIDVSALEPRAKFAMIARADYFTRGRSFGVMEVDEERVLTIEKPYERFRLHLYRFRPAPRGSGIAMDNFGYAKVVLSKLPIGETAMVDVYAAPPPAPPIGQVLVTIPPKAK
jgi:hypothetical protein